MVKDVVLCYIQKYYVLCIWYIYLNDGLIGVMCSSKSKEYWQGLYNVDCIDYEYGLW